MTEKPQYLQISTSSISSFHTSHHHPVFPFNNINTPLYIFHGSYLQTSHLFQSFLCYFRCSTFIFHDSYRYYKLPTCSIPASIISTVPPLYSIFCFTNFPPIILFSLSHLYIPCFLLQTSHLRYSCLYYFRCFTSIFHVSNY